ncbi:MAG: glycosyl hydrolase family 16 [Formosa sp.]|nr:glycosyl hydrolase family 16 [Formosa sp.]
MKNLKFIHSKITLLTGLLLVILMSCERETSDQTEFATLSKTGEIFTDTPIGLGSDFYFPYLGSKATAWSVDESEGYESYASMRFDVPNANDPEGNYAGGILRVDGSGRDLTEFDALTFWAKASQGVVIGEIGFGQDFGLNQYQVNETNISLSTNWVKYVIPIPDPSKLFDERGMFWYSAGTQNTGGNGYTFWIDELKFEKLGTIGQPRPAIANGQDLVQDAFSGIDLELTGLTQTFNLGSGLNKTLNVAPSYFDFTSSDPSLAFVDQFGVITVNSGTAVITASLGGVEAQGSMTVNAVGSFEVAPTPTRAANNVISLYSDSYTNVPVDFFNGYWEPWQTTLSSDFVVNGNTMINYTNFNFVGNQFSNPTVDATEFSKLHFNINIPEVPSNLDLLITVKDFGADQADGGGDDTIQQVFFDVSDFEAGEWSTLEFSISLANRTNIGQIIYENVNGSSLTEFFLDNIYFYRGN